MITEDKPIRAIAFNGATYTVVITGRCESTEGDKITLSKATIVVGENTSNEPDTILSLGTVTIDTATMGAVGDKKPTKLDPSHN